MKHGRRLVYNNYQFYENDALVKFIEKQTEEGNYPCGMIGRWANILKFRHEDTGMKKSYAIYCKNLDGQADTGIEKMKTGKWEIACENMQFIIFGSPSGDAPEKDFASVQKKQNILLGVSLKKSLALIGILFLVTIAFLSLKLFLAGNEISPLYLLKCSLCIALDIIFLFYFIGDLHDMKAGKSVHTNGVVYFCDRTKFKNVMFRLGDICRLVLLLACIFTSILLLSSSRDWNTLLDLLRMWLMYLIGGYFAKVKFWRSYVSLLFASAFLVVLGF